MNLISICHKEIQFLSCFSDFYSKYVRVFPLKNKTSVTIKTEFGRKPNELRVDQGGKFYNRSIKLWLQDNDMEIYSTHDEKKNFLVNNH